MTVGNGRQSSQCRLHRPRRNLPSYCPACSAESWMSQRVRMENMSRLQLKTHEHLSKVFARGKDRNLPAAHFGILASFRGYTLAILYSRFGSRLRLQRPRIRAWALSHNSLHRGPLRDRPRTFMIGILEVLVKYCTALARVREREE